MGEDVNDQKMVSVDNIEFRSKGHVWEIALVNVTSWRLESCATRKELTTEGALEFYYFKQLPF